MRRYTADLAIPMNLIHPDSEEYAAARAGTIYHRFARAVVRGTGADRLDLLHRLSTNATRDLAPGTETTTILTSEKGRVIEVIRVVALDDAILLVLAGADADRVIAWLDKYTIMDDFATANVSSEYVLVGVYGDYAKALVERTLAIAAPNAGAVVTTATTPPAIVLRDNRLTGAGGFLLMLPAAAADETVALLEAGGARSIGEATYDVLRVEAGLPAMGTELTEGYNPLEAGLSQFISWTKGCYIGQEVIARLDSYDKVQRHLVGLTLGGPLEAGMVDTEAAIDLRDPSDAKKVGTVTSMVSSPAMGRTIALAYVRTNHAVPGAHLDVVPVAAAAEGATAPPVPAVADATIVKLPFNR